MVYSVNSHTNANSKRWHLWETGLRFALNSTPGWLGEATATSQRAGHDEEGSYLRLIDFCITQF